MHALDWLVVAVYAAVIVGIGVYATKRQTGTDEYFRGSKTIPWWAIGISIIATAFSAASLIGGPGEGYGHGLLWFHCASLLKLEGSEGVRTHERRVQASSMANLVFLSRRLRM